MRQTAAALVERYTPLVKRIAWYMRRSLPAAVERKDLEQAGAEALIKAGARYRATNGATFETFAGYRIRGAMIDSVRKSDWTPRPVRQAAREIEKAIRTVEVREQRPARESEIAELMGLSPTAYRRMLHDTRSMHIFSESEAECSQLTDGLTSSPPAPEEALERKGFETALHRAIAALPERERLVIEMGLNDLTLRETGEALGITESRVCQIRTRAISRLRAELSET